MLRDQAGLLVDWLSAKSSIKNHFRIMLPGVCWKSMFVFTVPAEKFATLSSVRVDGAPRFVHTGFELKLPSAKSSNKNHFLPIWSGTLVVSMLVNVPASNCASVESTC